MSDDPEDVTQSRSEPVTQAPSDDAKRKAARDRQARRRQRTADPSRTVVGGRPVAERPAKGNPLGINWGNKVGETLGVDETRRQLYHAHVAVARMVRSQADLGDLEEEFDAAAEAYADVANHILPPMRYLPRIIAPLVLVGALIAIWAVIVAETPWVQRLRSWWSNREQAAAAPEQPPSPVNGGLVPPSVVHDQAPEQANGHVDAELPPVPNLGRMRIR